MRKLYLLIACLCFAWTAQAQNLEQKIEGDTACVYTDNKREDLTSKEGMGEFFCAMDSVASRQMATEIGNRILPDRVKALVKEELGKAPEERGGLVVKYLYNREGAILSADVSVWGNLYEQISKDEVETMYANLMKEKIDMTKGEIRFIRAKDETATVQYARGTLWFVSDEPFMTFAGPNVVDLK